MDFLPALAPLTIAIAAILTFYTAILHLTRRKIKRSHLFRVVRDLIVGTQTLQLFFLSRGMQLEHPFLLYPFVTLLFVSGPLNYLRYYWFFYPGGLWELLRDEDRLVAMTEFLSESTGG